MAAASTRSPTNSLSLSNASPSQHQHRPVAKKSSMLSLKRGKKSISSIDSSLSPTSPSLGRSGQGDVHMSPSSFHGPHLHDAAKSSASRPRETRDRSQSRKPSKSVSSTHEHPTTNAPRIRERHQGKERRHCSEQEPVFFPRMSMSSDTHVLPPTRQRSHTGPDRHWESPTYHNRQFNVSLLDSASSVLSQYEDVPRTPVDEMIFRESVFRTLPVVVAAPVAGVETMDALVDGMNSRYGADDHFMGSGGISGRTKISKSGYHPLYHPPLPTPPPGVVLGKANVRRPAIQPQTRDSDEDDEDTTKINVPRWSERRNKRRPGSARTVTSTTTATIHHHPSRPSSSRSTDTYETAVGSTYTSPIKTSAPSISEIIRMHAPAQQSRSRKSSYSQSIGHGIVREEVVEQPTELPLIESDNDLISRSSVDTIAEEVQRTIHNHNVSAISPPLLHQQRSFPRSSGVSDSAKSISSPRSDSRRDSLFSHSTTSDLPPNPPLDLSTLTKPPTNSRSQAIAQYLRSARLTTLLTLTRAPHASCDHPLTVSLSDLGNPNGMPLVIFLGLGCVRHIMGLYDEMAECLGIRLITIDRWGLGRTGNPRSKTARGISEWASVVEEILDQLHIDQCSVMAHSAGAPYALAFANKYPERIRGDLCLLAPWVGGSEGAGYKWLKYVPHGILKTAQAAEWKIQAWMIGKPPTFAFEGIGFDANSPVSPTPERVTHPASSRNPSSSHKTVSAKLSKEVIPVRTVKSKDSRPSISSGAFSEYDDLRDFDGRFESRSTLECHSDEDHDRTVTMLTTPQRKPTRGFLGRLKSGNGSSQPQSPQERPSSARKTLKALRSMGSLKSRSRPGTATQETASPQLPWLPPPASTDVGLGLDNVDWSETLRQKSTSAPPSATATMTLPRAMGVADTPDFDDHTYSPRANGRRSVSFSVAERSATTSPSLVSSPAPEADTSPASFQAALGSALVAASHAESSRGTHRDLLQILNHDRQPWGFSYAAYPHTVRIWYGDRDEKIAENAVRWMENTMGPDKCHVKVVKGADHALMYRSSVVVDVLEKVCDFWHEYD